MFATTLFYHVFPNINNRSQFKLKFNVSKIDGTYGAFAGGKLMESSKDSHIAFMCYQSLFMRCLDYSGGVILEEYFDSRIDPYYEKRIRELIKNG